MWSVKRFLHPIHAAFAGFFILALFLLACLPIYLLGKRGHYVYALIYILLWPLILNILVGSTCEIAGFLSRRRERNGRGE